MAAYGVVDAAYHAAPVPDSSCAKGAPSGPIPWLLLAMQVRVLGEAYTPDDDEDSGDAVVSNVWLYQARYRCVCWVTDQAPGVRWQQGMTVMSLAHSRP